MQDIRVFFGKYDVVQISKISAEESYTPDWITKKYNAYRINILDSEYLAIEVEPGSNWRVVIKRINALVANNYMPLVISKSLPNKIQHVFVENRLDYIVPGQKLFLPSMGIMQQRLPKESLLEPGKLTMLAQKIILSNLYKKECLYTVNQIAKENNVTSMAVSKAFDELAMIEPDIIVRDGARRYILWEPAKLREVYEKFMDYMRSPVKRTILVPEAAVSEFLLSGEYALEYYCMLGANKRYRNYAINFRELKLNPQLHYSARQLSDTRLKGEALAKLEVWSYLIPFRVGEVNVVDPLSLFITIEESQPNILQEVRYEGAKENIIDKILNQPCDYSDIEQWQFEL